MFTTITAVVTGLAALVLIGSFALSFSRSKVRRPPDLQAIRARARRMHRERRGAGRLP